MDLQLKDKVIIVTGGAKGIGEAIVRSCAGEGAVPVIVGRDGNAGSRLQSELQNSGAKCGLITVDLSPPENCLQAVEEVLKSFGRLEARANTSRHCSKTWSITTAWPITLCRTSSDRGVRL
jgi:NAD(P)-dependent dehydrogenase (short-subunit alcohol dehydrogenase family)